MRVAVRKPAGMSSKRRTVLPLEAPGAGTGWTGLESTKGCFTMADPKPMDFPKPPPKQPLSLPSRPGALARIDEREAQLKQGFEELMALERKLQAEREEFEEKRADLENRSRALFEAELLLKNQRMLHQKQMSQLMEQKDLLELRAKLEQQEDDLRDKEAFLLQTEKRLGQQLAARELDLSKREAWVSAEHEKASKKHARRLQAVVFTDVVGFSALMQTDESRTIQRVGADLQRMREAGRTNGGTLIRVPVEDISIRRRRSGGVTVFKVDEGERVVSVARLPDTAVEVGNGEAGIEEEGTSP